MENWHSTPRQLLMWVGIHIQTEDLQQKRTIESLVRERSLVREICTKPMGAVAKKLEYKQKRDNRSSMVAGIYTLKGFGYLQNVHWFTLNLHGLKMMIVESFPSNNTYWGAVVFEKWVKQSQNNFRLTETKIILAFKNPLTRVIMAGLSHLDRFTPDPPRAYLGNSHPWGIATPAVKPQGFL